MEFNQHCQECPRLVEFLKKTKESNPSHLCQPVPSFGSQKPKLLIVGLAPGMHGANKTGRPFTGDFAGVLLYETIFKFGFSSSPISESRDDNLNLLNIRITNAVKCLPPENKPSLNEIKQCNNYLTNEINNIKGKIKILALGKIAHDSVLMALGQKKSFYKFSHGAIHQLSKHKILYDSYHCSRYNTQTKRLTSSMFDDIFLKIKQDMEN